MPVLQNESRSFVALGMTTFAVWIADDCWVVGAADRSKMPP